MSYKYNYIILGSQWDFYKAAYDEIIEENIIPYISKPIDNFFLAKVYSFHTNQRVNSILNLPGKNWWNHIIIDKHIKDRQNLCFVVFYDWFTLNIGTIEYIRSKYPNSKIVVVFNDLISMKTMRFSGRKLDIEYLKSIADKVITFDFREASLYNINYHAIPYSTPRNRLMIRQPEYDIYFLGQAKNRLNEILETYYKLSEIGAKLNFILANVPINKQVSLPGLSYVNGMGISYAENIINVENCRCILEIMQKNGTGYTSRTLEAVAYDKMLLTNNKYILSAPFYNPKFISYFNKASNIDYDFVRNIHGVHQVDYEFKANLSPKRLLSFIESLL